MAALTCSGITRTPIRFGPRRPGKSWRRADSSQTDMGDIASHHVNLGVQHRWRKFDLGARMNFVSGRPTVGSNPVPEVPGYTVTNVGVTYDILPGLAAQLVVNNIFDASVLRSRRADGRQHPLCGARSTAGAIILREAPRAPVVLSSARGQGRRINHRAVRLTFRCFHECQSALVKIPCFSSNRACDSHW